MIGLRFRIVLNPFLKLPPRSDLQWGKLAHRLQCSGPYFRIAIELARCLRKGLEQGRNQLQIHGRGICEQGLLAIQHIAVFRRERRIGDQLAGKSRARGCFNEGVEHEQHGTSHRGIGPAPQNCSSKLKR